MASVFRTRLFGLADWLYGCSHRRTTFPRTLRASASAGGQQHTEPETYIVCLECGRHFAYDWTRMRVARQRIARTEAGRVPGRMSDLSRAVQIGFPLEVEADRGSRG